MLYINFYHQTSQCVCILLIRRRHCSDPLPSSPAILPYHVFTDSLLYYVLQVIASCSVAYTHCLIKITADINEETVLRNTRGTENKVPK